jgi:Raf kinase inhibitor-like YbhB/YbcL family protein
MTRRLAPLLALLLAAPALAAPKAGGLAVDRIDAPATFTLASRDFKNGAAIPKKFTAFGDGVSPQIAWSGLPEGTKSLALVMEDASSGSKPALHWIAWNIDPAARSMASGSVTPGARMGRNHRGTPVYLGPQSSSRTARQYHFQMFALDSQLNLRPGSSRDQLLSAMTGKVLGEAVLVGTFAKD